MKSFGPSGRRAFSLRSPETIPAAVLSFNRACAGSFRFSIQGAVSRRRVALYDTFDWRLYRAGLALMTGRARTDLVSAVDGSVLQSGSALPGERLAGDALPPGPLRDRLRDVTGARALLRMGSTETEARACRVCDDIGKTIARALWTRAAATGSHGVVLAPLRGFDREAEQLIEDATRGQSAQPYAGFTSSLLAAGGREPGVYSARVSISLDADQPIAKSLACVIRSLSLVMTENLPGLLGDWDTEFLHDYRVAIRRLKSVISETADLLPPDFPTRLEQILRILGRGTGEVRDFDVLLGKDGAYRQSLPPQLHPGLEEFLQWVRQKRQAAFGDLRRRLTDAEVRRSLESFGEVAEQLDSLDAGGGPSSRDCAARPIRRRLRRVLARLGQGEEEDDARLHRLRIECKKLRYLLEVFSSMFDQEVVSGLTDELREFQDSLGQLHDLAVGQTVLTGMLERMRGEVGSVVQVAASIGGLITETARQRPALVDRFIRARRRFRRRALAADTRRAFVASQGGAE